VRVSGRERERESEENRAGYAERKKNIDREISHKEMREKVALFPTLISQEPSVKALLLESNAGMSE
jgi:hypothetical protein